MESMNADSPLDPRQRDAVAAVCLLAARADGVKTAAERNELQEIFAALGGVSSAALYRRVMLGGVGVADVAADLDDHDLRHFAFEMAVAVCDADGHTTPAEAAFLEALARELEIPRAEAGRVRSDAERLSEPDFAGSPLRAGRREAPTVTATRSAAATASTPPATAATAQRTPGGELIHAPPEVAGARPGRDAEGNATAAQAAGADSDLGATITQHAVLAGALELLPQSLAGMAVVPLQLKLVHTVAGRYGYSLTSGGARDFLAFAGVGMASQVVEGFARKLFGKAAKKALGKKLGKGVGKLGKKATGPLMSFATTYAVGMAAERYYANDRRISADELRELFQSELARGRELFDRHSGEVRARAKTTRMSDLTSLLGR